MNTTLVMSMQDYDFIVPNRPDTPFIIYALREEFTDELRYIGKSCSGLGRPKQHKKPREIGKNYPIHSWIKNVYSRRCRIEIVVLKVLKSKEELDQNEIKCISHYRTIGHRLTNICEGGGGAKGLIPWNKGKKNCYPPKVLEIMSSRKKGKKWTDDHLKSFKESIIEGKKNGTNTMGHNLSKPIRCVTDGLEFPSMKAACDFYGYSRVDIKRSMKGVASFRSKVKRDGKKFEWINPNQITHSAYCMNKVKHGPKGSFIHLVEPTQDVDERD